MLLVLAATLQVLLIVELLLRRLLYLVLPAKRTSIQRLADNSVMSSLVTAVLQAATVPLQAAASLLASGTRVWVILILLAALFTTLLVLSNSSVYAYSALARMYNFGVAPSVGALKWLFGLLDFPFRAFVPIWNGWIYFLAQVLRRVVLPSSFAHVDVLPELLQAVVLTLGALGQSIVTWLGNVFGCTLAFEVAARECAGAAGLNGLNSTRRVDCVAVFSPVDARCYAAPNHLALDLLTPGLFARQAAQSLQSAIANSCGVAAIVLNLAMYPLCDTQLWTALHAGVNTVVHVLVGLPIATWRRCEALREERATFGLRAVHVNVGCTPDWQPAAAMAESALASLGKALDNWLNAAAVLVNERVAGKTQECETSVPLKQIVLDAARAIEGLESVEALERLQGRNGLPEGETLRSVRVVGMTERLFGVTDGKSVLYRSAHDGYVLAFGAWPLQVDVRFGLAAVTYGGSSAEADGDGSARTGLLGCRCVDQPRFGLLCATAPYVQHIDDGRAGLNASSMHLVSFPELELAGLTCQNTAVRVMPLRWPRRRMAATGGGFDGYDRFSFRDTVNRYTGDVDATDNLRLLAARERALPSGAVEAAVYVQPVCGTSSSVACAPMERDTCYPWCMGVVRGGRRAQNITMYNARRWEEHVLLPDVDCGVARDRGTCAAATGPQLPLVDLMEQAGLVRGRCAASCTPAAVPAAVASLVPLEGVDAGANSTLGLVKAHKSNWFAVRLEQPVVVAGDVMLGVHPAGQGERARLVVTRLLDVGQSTLHMASERLTLASNAHAVEVEECPTQADTKCVAAAMQAGRVVLPPAVLQVFGGAADAGVVVPAAASRWAVHWAQNPEVSVYNTLFEFCRNATPHFSMTVHSSYNRARVWTLQTMRAVDLESNGAPSAEQTRSRVSYMRVPYFLGKHDFTERACDKVVGLQIVGVEYLNEQNVLVTVLAARPKDYDARAGRIVGARTHRYYYLHPGRSDCRHTDDEDRLLDDPKIFSCWRSHASGMWPADDLLTGGVWAKDAKLCVRPRLLPLFGTFLVMPAVAYVRILETSLDSVCALSAVLAADAQDPVRALEQLFTVQLQQSTFHAMVDSAGARLLRVDDIIAVAEWLAAFNARLASFVVNALTSVSSGSSNVDKAVAGVRTLVVAGAKVYEGLPSTDAPFATVEKMFREPIAYSGLHASVAVLTMADGIKEGVAMPAVVRAFMAAQLQLVSVFNLVLRLGRVVCLRLLQTVGAAAVGRQASAVSTVSAALVESRAIVENEYLDVMRFQCYGFAQMVGSDRAWGQALRHMCLLLPDTLEGVMTVGTVLAMEYPVVSCACRLGEGEALAGSGNAPDAVVALCLQRPLPAESVEWLLRVRFDGASRQQVCFAAMDSANVRLYTAFDKSYKRLFQMTQHAAQVMDGLLALITGDTVACDAFDVSPYVLSIIPEPVDYFSSCALTDDCRGRCYDEFAAFEEERAAHELLGSDGAQGEQLGVDTKLTVPLESLLFSLDDIEKGRHKPPFQILDAVEIPGAACAVVCGQVSQAAELRNRCMLVAGVRAEQRELAVAYYCLPIDVTQYVFQWPGMEAATLPAAGSARGFAAFEERVRAVYAASSWAARVGARDSVVAVADVPDSTAADANVANTRSLVTRVFWCVPGLPRRQILRTALQAERRADAVASPLYARNYLVSIEHLQVDVADDEAQDVVVRAYGYHMDSRQAYADATIAVRTWNAPERRCVQCTFASDPARFTEATCAPCADEQSDAVFVQQHVRACLRRDPAERAADSGASSAAEFACAESLALPTQRASVNGFVSSATRAQATLTLAGTQRAFAVGSSTLNVLQNSAQNGVYMDMQQQAHARVSIVSAVVYPPPLSKQALERLVLWSGAGAAPPAVDLELIAVNAQRSQGAWLHVLSLRVDAAGIQGAERSWLRAETQVKVHLNCSVMSCGACAYTSGEQPLASLQQLENLCYAAQQCGIERCAGTLVNMRKPLCNLGNVVTRELHAVRILLQGLWGAIADNVAMVVELTHQRRQQYQLKWPEKLVRQEACTAKDTIVSLAATVTSVLGAFSHMMQDVSVHHGFIGSNVDSRVHARYIMILTATTNVLASVFMWPVYQGLVLQKFFSCTANDVLYQIDTLVSSGQPTMSIRFGDPRAAQAIERAGIAVCLSEDVRQSLQDAGVRVREAGRAGEAGDATTLRVFRKISDAISSTIDIGLSAHVQYAYHVMDIWLTWGSSVIRGFMDLAQTVDWQNCKLPVVDTGLQSVGMCACGDEAHAIPAVEKSKAWTKHAFWCSGLLMLNEGDGSDLLVWNPFSLEQLLALKGNKGNGYADYLTCLHSRWNERSVHHGSTCEDFKPRDARLERQGVEVLQVVSRCRGNYQQGRWDEASALLALFEETEWQAMRYLSTSDSALLDDKYTRLRKQVVQLLESDADLRAEHALVLPQAVLACLGDALRAGVLQHDCHRGVTDFAYERAPGADTVHVDACKVLSGQATALSTARFLWTGNSRNHVPLAKLHATVLSAAERSSRAEQELAKLLAAVSQEFNGVIGVDFARELQQHVDVESFSTEGDELHQLVDCVVLGPYSAADLNSNVHAGEAGGGLVRAAVPQYHRGDPQSRAFNSRGATGGSSVRVALIKNVQQFINEQADDIVVREVARHVLKQAQIWLDTDNYRCACKDKTRSFQCCADSETASVEHDALLQSMLEESFDVSENIQAATFEQVINSKFLTETLWTLQAGESVPLQQEHRAALHAVHLFDAAAHVPVRAYDVDATAKELNKASLWETCTGRVAGLFATLPLTDAGTNVERGLRNSTVHSRPGAVENFDASRDSAEDRVHSMELLVEALLERARETTPHFWTHAHRYVASDSVWCEGGDRNFTEPPVTTTPTRLEEHALRPEPVLAPDADQLVYPADVLGACACGWQEAEGTCYIPAEVCTKGMHQLGDARLADGRSKREVWNSLCHGGVPAQTTASSQESSSYDPASNRCPAGTRVETPKLKSSSCAVEVGTDSTLCNCHKFDEGIIQMGGFDGYQNLLRCRWVLSADVNISIQVTNWKTSNELFFILKAPYTVNIKPNDIVFVSSQSPLTKTFTLTLGNYVEVYFGPIQEPMGWDRGVNASWSTLQCVPCDAGQYSGTADTSCLPCARGKYSQIVGATACTDCPLGSYQPATGQSTCLPGTTYNSPADKLAVLQVLQDLDSSLLKNCSARQLSIASGLLAPEEHEAWLAGARGKWNVSAQHLATFGPGGLRIGMLSPDAPETMQEYVRAFELGERLAGTFNARHGHTIAQPVCEGTLREHLREDLRLYFPDVFVPMAHAVQIAPPVEYCARWALEHAMAYVLRAVALTETALPEGVLERQESAALLWRGRCAAQMHEVGLCALRGVYDIVPNATDVPSSARPAAGCAFAGAAHTVSGCARLYYTSGCLLYCDGAFYDPCLCGGNGGPGECAPRPFAPANCTAGRVVDGRQLLDAADEVLLTSSLSLPADIQPAEAANDTHWTALRSVLAQAHAVSKLGDVDFDSIFARSAAELLARADDEGTPSGYCDDLFDYWPDAQHPVGYHPSTACAANASNTRGFDAWMSRNATGHALLDPVRMRNMTLASQVFGAAHLVCDAHAYAAPGHRLNPFYMQSRWDAQAPADAAVPAPADARTVDEMPVLGAPSYADTDTTLRGQGHSADSLMQHSVGLVRAWAQWFPLPNASAADTAAAKAALDARWPHWLPDEEVRGEPAEHGGLFLGNVAGPPAGCRLPRLRRCRTDGECHGLKCLLNYQEDENTRRGVCMPPATCYQHAHCESDKLCAGDGRCTEPLVRVRNKADWDSEVQLFGKAGCTVSMQRLSRFESVQDFAHANGMCSFRNWYHYRNTTADAPPVNFVKSVQDRNVLRTDRGDVLSLSELGVLRTLGHQCDRSYQHTDYNAYYADATVTRVSSGGVYPAQPVRAARTWRLDDSVWHARFCALQGGGDVSGFLSPYPDGSLLSAARDIKRCSKLGLCPHTRFHVRGRAVEARRVRVHVLNEDSPLGVARTNDARDYCGLDAQRCWGMGHLLGKDCVELDKELSALCVVDALALPLMAVAYDHKLLEPAGGSFEDSGLANQFAKLRLECPRAFSQVINGNKDIDLFAHVHEHLLRPYAWTDAVRRQQVLEYANGLLFMLFGVSVDNRGFTTVERYLQHSQCATFIARRLRTHEDEYARLETDNSFSFYASGDNVDAQRIYPGASLYLFDRRLPVAVNLRWALQCVVLAKNAGEGGAPGSFLVDLNSGRLAARDDTVECANYAHDPTDAAALPLSSWLRRARFLFTQQARQELHPLQITQDVFASIGRAIAQLPVFAMPDYVCVTAKDGWEQPGAQTSIFALDEPLERLDRFRNPALDFDVGAAETGIGTTQRIFADAGNTSVYEQVLKFLVEGTRKAGAEWSAQTSVMLEDLKDAGVLRDMHTLDKGDNVPPKDMYPLYEYVNLQKLPELYLATLKQFTYDTYTRDAGGFCDCSAKQREKLGSLCDNRRRLQQPEYSLVNKVRCEDLRQLPCTAQGATRLLDERRWMDRPFLTQQELLYLVLLVFQYEISFTASGGYTTLHRLRDPESAQFVDELFLDKLPNQDRVSLHEARQFNEFLEQHDSGSIKCPPTELRYDQETNKRHLQLRQCRDALRESIGWKLAKNEELALRPPRNALTAGFFLTHGQPNRTFLDDLFDTNWTSAEFSSIDDAICSVRPEATEVMAPFWAEYFDVASEDSAGEPSLACDFEASSPGSVLMVYDTLCSSSIGNPNARTCSEHPAYKERLQKLLPPACAAQDGRVVVRRRLGALKAGRLCDMRPPGLVEACPLKHGALNGHVGEHADNLDAVHAVRNVQTGLWDGANAIFRGAQVAQVSTELTALALREDDIAGHCLAFELSSRGTLELRGVALAKECTSLAAFGDAADVRAWLADVEQEWAWDHAHAAALHNESEPVAAGVAWTCPLHWLQRYHDDDGRHQARSPSSQRNAARFAHITGAHRYAHPTVRHANRLRGLRAARFLGDRRACVAAAEDCHGAEHLDKTIDDALQPAWRRVAYVPESHPECTRVLDWPADCGRAGPGGQTGECVLRT